MYVRSRVVRAAVGNLDGVCMPERVDVSAATGRDDANANTIVPALIRPAAVARSRLGS